MPKIGKPLGDARGLPAPVQFTPDTITQEVMLLVEQNFTENFGTLNRFDTELPESNLEFAFEHFIENALPQFGDYQDAMLRESAIPLSFGSLAVLACWAA